MSVSLDDLRVALMHHAFDVRLADGSLPSAETLERIKEITEVLADPDRLRQMAKEISQEEDTIDASRYARLMPYNTEYAPFSGISIEDTASYARDKVIWTPATGADGQPGYLSSGGLFRKTLPEGAKTTEKSAGSNSGIASSSKSAPSGQKSASKSDAQAARAAKLLTGAVPSKKDMQRLTEPDGKVSELRKLENQYHRKWEEFIAATLGSGWQVVGKSATADVFHKGLAFPDGVKRPIVIDGKVITATDQTVGSRQSARRGKLGAIAKNKDTIVCQIALNVSPSASEQEKGVYLFFGFGGWSMKGSGVKSGGAFQPIRLHGASPDDLERLKTPQGLKTLRKKIAAALIKLDKTEYQRMARHQSKESLKADFANAGVSARIAESLGVSAEEVGDEAAATLSSLSEEAQMFAIAKSLGGSTEEVSKKTAAILSNLSEEAQIAAAAAILSNLSQEARKRLGL